MFVPDSALAGELRRQCTPGNGELVTAPRCSDLVRIASGIGHIADNEVFLTPPPLAVCNPLIKPPDTYDVYRSPQDYRSFGITGRDRTHSLTVKGGDLPYMAQIPRSAVISKMRRVGARQIPGAGVLSVCQEEFDAAQNLQGWSLAQQGRLTHTAIPIRVSRITAIANRHGEMAAARDFMNSDEYLQPKESDRVHLRTAASLKLGTLLLDVFGLEPAAYMYAIKGVNVRVETLSRSRYFADGDKPRMRGIFMRNHKNLEDPLRSLSLDFQGDSIPAFEGRKDMVLRSVYHLLGNAYGFDARDVLPLAPITDRNYMRWLTLIPHRCQEKGITELVLSTFVDRVTEVAALAHAHGFVLGGEAGMGSALHARNVTLEGTVLDLNTMRPFPALWRDNILKDLNSLFVTVARLERMVAGTFPPTLIENIYEAYLGKLETFAQDKKVMHAIADVVRKSPDDPLTEFALNRIRYDQPKPQQWAP